MAKVTPKILKASSYMVSDNEDGTYTHDYSFIEPEIMTEEKKEQPLKISDTKCIQCQRYVTAKTILVKNGIVICKSCYAIFGLKKE